MMKMGESNNHVYCFSCGAKYPKEKYLWWPIKIKFYKHFSIGIHGYQVGYSVGLISNFARVIRLGFMRVILGYYKDYQRGIDCMYDPKLGLTLHQDIVEQRSVNVR